MEYKEINKRYSDLAESDCCLTCGGAINYCDARQDEVSWRGDGLEPDYRGSKF